MDWIAQITSLNTLAEGSLAQIATILAMAVTHIAGITIICSGIVLWAFVAYFLKFRRHIRPLVRQLDQVCAQMQATKGEHEFAARFHELDESFGANPLVGDTWREFNKSLLFPTDSSDSPVIFNASSSSPSEYFRRDALLGRKLNLRLYNAVPNLLTGTGILGTFIGLVAGIYLASGNLGSEDITRAQEAMQQLLHGASLAFLTSIAGLFSSLLFSLGEKHWIHRFDNRLGCWVSGLDQRLRRLSVESIARDQLLQIRQQTTVLEGFTDQLAFQIAEAMDVRISQSVAPLLNNLVEEMRSLGTGMKGQMVAALEASISPSLNTLVDETRALRTDRQGSNETALQKLVEEFTTKLEGSAGREIEALGQTLQSLNDILKEQTGKFDQSMEVLRETLREVYQVSSETRVVVEQIGGVASGLGQAVTAIQELASPITSAAERFQGAGNQIVRSSEGMEANLEKLTEATITLQEVHGQVGAAWHDYKQRFEGIDEALGVAFKRLEEGLQQYTDQVNTFVAGLDLHTAEISGLLGGSITELNEAVSDLSDTLASRR